MRLNHKKAAKIKAKIVSSIQDEFDIEKKF